MASRWFSWCLLAASLSLHAQGTKTRDNPSAYTAHAQFGSLAVAADLLGHFVPLENVTLETKGYLAVEVAFFAPAGTKIPIKTDQFVLKVNGRRLLPQPPKAVTLGYYFPDMRETHPRVEGSAGDVNVAVGGQGPEPKFPGDANPANRPPPPARDDTSLDTGQRLDAADAITRAALPEGSHAAPVSGYLFYAFDGKLKHVKHAELEYSSPAGTASLVLR
jgi:hypothetical protein